MCGKCFICNDDLFFSVCFLICVWVLWITLCPRDAQSLLLALFACIQCAGNEGELATCKVNTLTPVLTSLAQVFILEIDVSLLPIHNIIT